VVHPRGHPAALRATRHRRAECVGQLQGSAFDAKGEANAFFTRARGADHLLQTTLYYEGFLYGQGPHPHRNDTGELVLTLPMADNPLALIAGEDIGKTALGVFRRGGQFIGKTVSIAGTIATGEELAAKFTSALGEKVVYRPLSTEQMRASGPSNSPTVSSSIPTRRDTSPESATSSSCVSSTPNSKPSTPG